MKIHFKAFSNLVDKEDKYNENEISLLKNYSFPECDIDFKGRNSKVFSFDNKLEIIYSYQITIRPFLTQLYKLIHNKYFENKNELLSNGFNKKVFIQSPFSYLFLIDFDEYINLNSIVCNKIYKDFCNYENTTKENFYMSDFKVYLDFKELFKLASINGIVVIR